MKNLKIIGIGSPFGMDRLGWDTVDYLKKHKQHAIKHSQLIKLDRPATELLGYLDKEKKIIIIDAINGNDETGKVLQLTVTDLPETGSNLSSHGIGLSDALQLADTLGQLPSDLLIIGMETGGKTNEAPAPAHIKKIADQIIMEVSLYHQV